MMVNEQGVSNSGQSGSGDGFSAGTAISSFAGALVALLVGGGVATILWPDAPAPTSGSNGAPVSFESMDLQVPATGVEEFVQIAAAPRSVTLGFEEAGTYRIELRALDGSSDPLLTLFSDGSDIPFGTNDDAPGTLDAILPVRVAEAGDSWRVDLSSFGETSGPSVLRVLPAAEGEEMGPALTSGPGAFPAGDIATLASDEATEAMVGAEGVWYRFKPATSGVYVLAIRAAEEDFDTVASLLPVLSGGTTPVVGTDVTMLGTAFTSDDDDGLNPRFARYMQEGADYFLFVRGFEAGAQGSIAITLELAGADTPLVLENQMEEVHEDMNVEPEVELETQGSNGSNKLNAR